MFHIFLSCILLFKASLFVAAADFDPESVVFSQRETIKTWLASQYFSEKALSFVQANVARLLPQYPQSFVQFVPQNEGQTADYGKAFRTIASVELPFLQFVHSLEGSPITLELAAGLGYVTWKVPLAFETKGMHYANDLSQKGTQFSKDSLESAFNAKEVFQVTFDCGDCFTILDRHPELRGRVNAVMVQNLEHFFNPQQHQRFLALLSELLADDGRAYLCCHAHRFRTEPRDAMADLYFERKRAGDIYPGFAQATTSFFQLKGRAEQLTGDAFFACLRRKGFEVPEEFVVDVARPADDAIFDLTTLSVQEMPFMLPFDGEELPILFLKQRFQHNTFSPSVYRASVAMHPSLEVIDTFFVDQLGARADSWLSMTKTPHAAAILGRKKRDVAS